MPTINSSDHTTVGLSLKLESSRKWELRVRGHFLTLRQLNRESASPNRLKPALTSGHRCDPRRDRQCLGPPRFGSRCHSPCHGRLAFRSDPRARRDEVIECGRSY